MIVNETHKEGILSLTLCPYIAIVSFRFVRVRVASYPSRRQVNTKINTIRISYGDYRQMRQMWPMPRRMANPKLSIRSKKRNGDDRIGQIISMIRLSPINYNFYDGFLCVPN